METMTKSADTLATLQSFEVFAGIDAQALQWLIDRSEYVCYPKGELLFWPGKETMHMQVIISGRFVAEFHRNGDVRELGVFETGHITGVLPFSRMKEAKAYGRALEDCCVLELHRDCFTEMVNTSFELTQALVSVMTTRVRDFTQQAFQNEKLMSLGKLSAGLAHELNNPASAMVRGAEELYRRIHQTPEKFKAVITMQVTPEETDQVNEILFSKIPNGGRLDLSLMEQEERRDDLIDWLEDHGLDEGDDIAETFVDFDLGPDDLDQIADIVKQRDLPAVLWWIESTLSLEKLVSELREASGRISELIQSIKSYSRMDRSTVMEKVDILEGLRSTVIMLKHKLKYKKIGIAKEIEKDLPPVMAYAGELNQVWTNLITNAIDAMKEGGTLTIRAYRERSYVMVEINDTGSGIAEENLTRVFDPFFTTKPMGEGTGLGLDIVQRIINRHNGDIKVTSEPGNTTFTLCFPIASANGGV